MSGSGSGGRKYIIIIGAMKCGTSSLYQALAGHPSICPCVVKEPEFFSTKQYHKRNADTYEELWPLFDPATHHYCLEASTGYSKFPVERDVPERMKAYQLDARFVYLVRDPIEQIESHIAHMARSGVRPDFLRGQGYAGRLGAYASYALQLERYRRVFKQSIMVIDLADLVNAPASVLAAILKRMQLPHSPHVAFSQVNRTRGDLPISRFSLSEEQKNWFREQLYPNMRYFKERYGFPVERWGF